MAKFLLGLISLVVFISCQAEPQQKNVEENNNIQKLPDANLQTFDAGTIQLLEHYAAEYEARDAKRKIEIAYKLHKAISSFENPIGSLKLLKDAVQLEKIYNYQLSLIDQATKFESGLTKKQRQEIFSNNEQSALSLIENGIIHRSVKCEKYFLQNVQIPQDLLFKHRNHIYDFLYFSDLYYIHDYLGKLISLLKELKGSAELIDFYQNIQGYYSKKSVAEADKNYDKLLETFLKITDKKISIPHIKDLYRKHGECFWSNARSFNIAVMGLLTKTRAIWINDLINQQKIKFVAGELVSVSFNQADFPYDRPLDAWNKFFKFKIINNKQFIVSEGEKPDEISDDLEFELK